jgi:hypothetical protein
MCETIVIREGDALRSVVETFIRNVYSAEYDAQLQTFPSRLFALMNERAEIICAAGVRLQEDGFFSELYLDSPIEQAFGTASKRAITRSEIFEVTTFASRAPRATMQFIKSLGMFGELNGFAWSFFTLTERLHRLVERFGHPLTHLADAMADRVSANSKHHGHRVARKLRRPCRGDISCGGNRDDTHSYKFGRKGRQCAIVTASPPFLNSNIAAFDEARLRQTFSKRVSIEAVVSGDALFRKPTNGVCRCANAARGKAAAAPPTTVGSGERRLRLGCALNRFGFGPRCTCDNKRAGLMLSPFDAAPGAR